MRLVQQLVLRGARCLQTTVSIAEVAGTRTVWCQSLVGTSVRGPIEDTTAAPHAWRRHSTWTLQPVSEAAGRLGTARVSAARECGESAAGSCASATSTRGCLPQLASRRGFASGAGRNRRWMDAVSEGYEDSESDDEDMQTNVSAAQRAADAQAVDDMETASKKRQKFLLQQMLNAGGASRDELDPRMQQDESHMKMKIVDVNRVSKGAKAGSMMRYSALIVVGNANGVLGFGKGKAADANSAVKKAYAHAQRNLTYVPRYHGHTVHYPITCFMGKTKLIMEPRSSGTGVTASRLMSAICKLAGIQDVMIKIQGSRNARNSVQALFKALDDMQLRLANV